jgi:hypothetical protein
MTPPGDGRFELVLQERRTDEWASVDVRQTAQGATPRFEGLRAGRYRLYDRLSGVGSAPIDVVPVASAVATLDLSAAAEVEGVIESPDGIRLVEARLFVDGEPAPRGRLRGNGTFRVRVPGDRDVTLRATHPLLREATAVVRAGQSAVVLRLAAGARATLTLDREPPGDEGGRVLLFDGVAAGTPAFEGDVFVEGRSVTFGGFSPGTWTVLVDLPPFAPIVLEDHRLTGGANDLGAVAVSDGARIRVKVLTAGGLHPPQIGVAAEHRGAPRYVRRTSSHRGETEIVLAGLGAGTFDVACRPLWAPTTTGAPPRVLPRVTVERDGEAQIVLDLR